MKNEHFARLVRQLRSNFGAEDFACFSAPGRTELIGNHTDHQQGHVVAAAVTLSLDAAAAVTHTGVLRVRSRGMDDVDIALDSLDAQETERGTSAALVRGIAAGFAARGANFAGRGIDMCVDGDVPVGSGLSSSASFELLVTTAIDELLFCGALSPLERAKTARRAENDYFGKPCGLMDELACAVGGVCAMDFAEPETPAVTRLELNLESCGYALCLVDSHSGHENLTAEYSAVTQEMGLVARHFGCEYLRGISLDELLASLPELRRSVGDRACMRALHFVSEDERASRAAEALGSGNFDAFLELVRESGASSAAYLQNISPAGAVASQPMALTLAVCTSLLHGRGAARVHGGGFGGAAQCYVPLDSLSDFTDGCERALGAGSVRRLYLRPSGAERISLPLFMED